MVSRSEFRKKSNTPSEDSREKDRLITELKNYIAVLENELRLKRECAPFLKAAERKQADEALKLTQFAMDNFRDSAIWLTMDGRIIYVNQAACKSLGYSREELLSMHIWDIDPDYTMERFRELWKDVKQQGYTLKFESRHIARDGRAFIAEVTSSYTRYGNTEYLITFDRDITERKKAEAELIKKNDDLVALNGKLRGLSQAVQQSASVIVITDTTGSIQYVNPKFTALTGYSFEEAIGKNPSILKTGETPPEEYKQLWETIMSGKDWHGVFHNRKKNGDLYWESAIISPIMDDSGKITNFIAVKEDITERKRAEEALRESEERFHALADNIPVMAWMANADGSIFWFNKQCYDYTGMTLEELQGLGWQKVLHPDYVKAATEVWQSMIKTGQSRENIFPMRFKDGSFRWFLTRSRPIRNEGGTITRWFGTQTDITDRKNAEEALQENQEELKVQAEELRVNNEELERQIEERLRVEEALRESEEKFRILADSTYDWVVWSGPTGNYVYVSPSCERITGHRDDEFHNDPGLLNRIVHPDDMVTFEQHMDTHLRNASICGNFDFRIISTSGETRWINHVCRPVFRDNGEWLGRRASNRDITERKRAEKELEDYRKRLEDLVQERTCKLDEEKRQVEMYVDLMSHDISNMNQVGLGFLELALDMLDLDEADREMLLNPKSAFEKSSRLIDNVRKLQKARSGEYESKEMDIGQVLGKVQEHYTKQYGQGITLNYLMNVGYVVKANELLYDLFSNLVANAIKHSRGHPIIDIKVEQVSDNGRDYYKIAIDDRGPGVPDRLKSIIFDRKLTGDACSKGSGIGLFLVKTLVDGYRGRVWVEDRIKGDCTRGARFVVMLPVCEVESGNAKR